MKRLGVILVVIIFCFAFSCEEEEKCHECGINETDRVGAICNDGTRSDATGSGACSHHEGVDYWLCADD